MSVVTIGGNPYNAEEFSQWTFAHALEHQFLLRRLIAAFGTRVSNTIMDPLTERNIDTFMYKHQLIHRQIDALFNTPNMIMPIVDWNDPVQREQWINMNYQQHLLYEQLLGG